MPLLPLLLRVFLSLVLIVTGTGNVIAATQMQLEHAAREQAARERAASTAGHAGLLARQAAAHGESVAASDCHPAVDATAAHPDMDWSAVQDHGQPDCCQTNHCDGYCVQQVPVAFAGPWLAEAPPMRGLESVTATAGHPSPALPLPKRPPIAA